MTVNFTLRIYYVTISQFIFEWATISLSRVLTKTEKCSPTKTDQFVGFTKPERQKNIRGTESYVKREFVQNRRSFHEGKAVMKPNLKSTLGHNKTFQAVLFGEEHKREF